MKYFVRIGTEVRELELDGDTVVLEGRTYRTQLADITGTPIRAVTIGDAVHRVVVRRGEAQGSYVLWLGGHRFDVEALDERAHAIRELSRKTGAVPASAPLVAPMPGLIVRVQVAVGDTVRAQQGVVVMEAMKMENELRVQADGTVKAVHVAAGTAVEKGAVLIEFD